MSSRSHVLFNYLVEDLSNVLRTCNYLSLFGGNARGLEWPGATGRDVACLSLLDSIFKKFEDGKGDTADTAALAKFLACNSRCKEFKTIDTRNMSEISAIALGETKEAIRRFFTLAYDEPLLNAAVISQHIDVGPGASVGVKGNSFYHKVGIGALTGTRSSLFSLYKREISRYPLWAETEKIRSAYLGGFVEVAGSKLSFAPKSAEISRTICTEPLLNMLFQKGIGTVLENRLRSLWGITLKDQADRNRELAKIGSEKGAYGTIDLSSASDTVSIGLLREILPKTVLSWLMETRSPSVQLPDGSLLPLHMVSSMGNGFTFPLQTILFSSVIIGVYRALNIEVVHPSGWILGNFGAFGDDLIVRKEAYDLVVDILTRLGFEVNTAKSYNVGPFRESCGSDFWSGYDVRGVYCHTLQTRQDLYSLVNRLNVWSANHGIYLRRTVEYLLGLTGKLNPVPPWESDVAGVKVPYGMLMPSSAKRDKWTGSIVYMRYMPVPESLSLLNIESRPPYHRGNFSNPAGVLLSAVGGYLRDGKIHTRQDLPYYKKRMAIAPSWDYRHPLRSTLTSVGWQRWVTTIVEVNFGSCSLST